MDDEIRITIPDNVVAAVYDALHRDGDWDNPGTLPDEINRDAWRAAVTAGVSKFVRTDEFIRLYAFIEAA
jgi:hypothetical protein